MREPPRFLGLDWLGLLAAVTLEIPGGGVARGTWGTVACGAGQTKLLSGRSEQQSLEASARSIPEQRGKFTAE